MTDTSFLTRDDGTRLAYAHSPGSGPGIVFLAGFNSNMGGDKALALEHWCREQGRQFTRFDYFGHGQSSGTLAEGSIGRWRDDTIAIIEQLTSGPQLLVGSSMGGWLMLLVAIARPERVTALCGIAAAPDFTERLHDQRLNEQQRRELSETGFCELPNHYDDGEPHRISRYLLEEGATHRVLHSEIAIDVPVRLIHGQCDDDVPWQLSLEIAQQLRSSDVEVQLVKNGDHRLSTPRDIERLLRTVALL
tara:strand:- start:237292 stop:238035 length:744 start_codon:yes stop_codon:yes gene_type:complete